MTAALRGLVFIWGSWDKRTRENSYAIDYGPAPSRTYYEQHGEEVHAVSEYDCTPLGWYTGNVPGRIVGKVGHMPERSVIDATRPKP